VQDLNAFGEGRIRSSASYMFETTEWISKGSGAGILHCKLSFECNFR